MTFHQETTRMKTTMSFTRRTGLALAAMACMLVQGQALAQTYPTKPIKFVVPFSAGSATDIVARTVADAMGKSMGQTIVIDNRLGAGGTIAAALVAKSDADGYTVLVHSSGHALNASLYPNLAYDTVKDLTGVTTLAAIPNVLVVNPAKGWKTQADLINAVKAKPGTFNYASAGVGSGSASNARFTRPSAAVRSGTPSKCTSQRVPARRAVSTVSQRRPACRRAPTASRSVRSVMRST
jgi:tripartite-type tricarboxylate transporter receptor subunit TctC